MKPVHLLGALGLVLMAGCATLQDTAPTVSPEMAAHASKLGVTADTLEVGRRLMAMRCTTCHSLEPIANYTASKWADIVDDMADRSGLDAEQAQQVTAYLQAARAML